MTYFSGRVHSIIYQDVAQVFYILRVVLDPEEEDGSGGLTFTPRSTKPVTVRGHIPGLPISTGTWFGFDEELDNGYYDPDLYQSYMATGLAYWKISDDDGITVATDLGAVKDDDMDDFDFGWAFPSKASSDCIAT